MKTFFIIVNPNADHGQAANIWEQVEQILLTRQVKYEAHQTTRVGHAKQLIHLNFGKQKAENIKDQVVLVVGGDGTLNETLNALKHEAPLEVPLAFIPVGHNNGFAKGIGIASDPLVALDQILAATEPTYYNVGEYQETTHNEQGYFLNDFGIGLDAYTISLNANVHKHMRLRKFLLKLHLNFLAYLINVFTAFLNQEAFAVTLRIGDKYEFFKHARLVNIANHPYFENGIILSPKADINDHQLDLIIADNLGFFKFLALSIAIYFKKQLKLPYIHHYKDKNIHLIINSLEYGQIDGEEAGSKYYDIFFGTIKYPFWINIQGVPVTKRV
ncbi:transcription regulator [Ligilactobacillus murinus DSM 20452 = NBRC 14221]|uniref:Transcription regulator n=1 Tax=Ligilactobacillus murinus DSM 20452 = NBRC 14221 TaxID=1423772 RepID=A0A0R2BAI2_9LACO|nr:YegS/Rv2252/BmrU family lipid kinase [Ligilactobacillus murinus]KRM73547.1 transcription regulator [Ligilactobacillus murinus DSM 20452 = NBRC 14221]